MAVDAHANFAYSTVATAPSPATSGTSLVVQAGQGALFPSGSFDVTIWPTGVNAIATNAEIARGSMSGDTMNLVRGTPARSIVVGDQITASITNKVLTDAESAFGGVTATTPKAARASTALNTESYTGINDANYTGLVTDNAIVYTAITAARTVTLPAANGVNAGHLIIVGDISGSVTSTNTITVQRAGSDTIDGTTTDVISVSYGVRVYVSDGTSKWVVDKSQYQPVAGAGVTLTNDDTAKTTTFAAKGINYQEFTTVGTPTWTRPANALAVFVETTGAGGGGAGGATGAAGTNRSGGGGGGAGGIRRNWLDPADLGSTETVTIADGGAGGAGGGTGGASGSNGVNATATSFGSHISVSGASAFFVAVGGSTVDVSGGAGSQDSDIISGILFSTVLVPGPGGGARVSTAGNSFNGGGGAAGSAGGGAGGGSIDSTNTKRNAGTGGIGDPAANTGGAGGSSAVNGQAGTAGTNASTKAGFGGGGGGGAPSTSSATSGGVGGAGGAPGGGGGGGGAALSGGTAVGGTGGKGGKGRIRVWTWVGSGA